MINYSGPFALVLMQLIAIWLAKDGAATLAHKMQLESTNVIKLTMIRTTSTSLVPMRTPWKSRFMTSWLSRSIMDSNSMQATWLQKLHWDLALNLPITPISNRINTLSSSLIWKRSNMKHMITISILVLMIRLQLAEATFNQLAQSRPPKDSQVSMKMPFLIWYGLLQPKKSHRLELFTTF